MDTEKVDCREDWCKANCPYTPECSCDGVCNFVLSILKEQEKEIEELKASASAYAELLVKYGYDFK